ncbi:hypothetical protein ESCO47_00062 [Escherichia phage vB_EcoM_ESCO47]|nr:hypothetical protein ESCO47_00062 [Escherichia phage vB_EcoM_ESCO47]
MSLYDPSGDSENGVILLKGERTKEMDIDDVEVSSWTLIPGGICLEQDDNFICLDAGQVEALYSILKHNR